MSLINKRFRVLVEHAFYAVVASVFAIHLPIEAVRIIGYTVLTGAIYGFINDMIACRICIEYFTVGHVFDGQAHYRRVLKTLDPNLNALAWGVIATWQPCAVIGSVLAICAQLPIPTSSTTVTSSQLLPYFCVAAAATFIAAELVSSIVCRIVAHKKIAITFYTGVPDEYTLKWLSCDVRNSTGYLSLGIWMVWFIIAIILARSGRFKM